MSDFRVPIRCRLWSGQPQRDKITSNDLARHRAVACSASQSPRKHRSATGFWLTFECPLLFRAAYCLAPQGAKRARVRLANATNVSMTGTSTRTPTTVARAAPEFNPNKLMATATASSKKFDVPIKAQGAAMR